MANPIVTISPKYSNPDKLAWRTACENLSMCALGVLAWLYYVAEYFPNEPITLDELDPNCEPGVEPALDELAAAEYITLSEAEL